MAFSAAIVATLASSEQCVQRVTVSVQKTESYSQIRILFYLIICKCELMGLASFPVIYMNIS